MKIGLSLLILFFLVSCAFNQNTTTSTSPTPENESYLQELKSLHLDKYLEAPGPSPVLSHDNGWEVYRYDKQEYPCILGGEYFLMARPGSEPDKTVLWLDGGGACWPGRDDCTKEAQFYDSIQLSGLASLGERNPVRDWNFVYVPYCDGSLHMGDNRADYDGDGIVDHYHLGLKMTSAAVKLMAAFYPETHEILIAGCSAGGSGTILAAPVVRLQFPLARLYALNLSGTGLIKPGEGDIFELAKETWNVGQFIPADCTKCNQQITYMYAWLLARDANMKVGLFSSYHDKVVSSGWRMAPESFEMLLLETTGAIHAEFPKTFNRYFINGDQHCVGDFSYAVNGITIWDWLGYLIGDDPRWEDVLE